MLQRIPLIAVIMALLFATVAYADAEEGVARLQSYLADLDSLEARFVQTVETQDGRTGPVEGTLFVQRPGRFRWQYDGEIGQLIVADGRRIWLLDRELEQVSHQSQKAALRGTPAQLLLTEGALSEYFTAVDGGDFDGVTWVELKPLDEESQFNLVRVGFRDGVLDGLEMLDNFGQYTRFVLSDVKLNPGLDEALFKFQAPAGWDVFQTH